MDAVRNYVRKLNCFQLSAIKLLLPCILAVSGAFGRTNDSLDVTFRYDDSAHQYVRGFLPAEFNDWGPNTNGAIAIGAPSQMNYSGGGGPYWIKQVRLKTGVVYAYKFHFHYDQAGLQWTWIKDPLNPVTDNSGYSNSLIAVTDPMIFEPRMDWNFNGTLRAITLNVLGSRPFNRIIIVTDEDTTDVTSLRDATTGILRYAFQNQVKPMAISITGLDDVGRQAQFQEYYPERIAMPWEDEIFYQIFPRSFYDSDGDAVGDFEGIEEKLDYLQDLGVTALWLNPVYLARCYHNYFADSFELTDTAFGNNAKFIKLVKAVHSRGMKILLDMETQYIADLHPWYLSSYNDTTSPYGRYIWYNGPHNTQPEAGTLYSYDGKQIPIITLNFNYPPQREYQKYLYKYWIDPDGNGNFEDGVDGFRIDHIMDDLDYKHQNTNLYAGFWLPLFNAVRARNPRAFFVCEQADWADYGTAALQNADADAVFTIPLMFGIRTLNKSTILGQIQQTIASTPGGKYQFVIVENHDVTRFASAVGANPGKEKIGAALNLTLKGIPCLYYGQEIGMKGSKGNWGSDGNDIPLREAFEWHRTVAGPGMALWYANTGPWWTSSSLQNNDGISLEEEQIDSSSLWRYYRKLIHMRKDYPALRRGEYVTLMNPAANVLSFARQESSKHFEAVAIIVNLGDSSQQTAVDFTAVVDTPTLSPWYVRELTGNRSFPSITTENAASYPLTLAADEVLILHISSANASYTLSGGWNLISLPVAVPDRRKTALFPTAISNSFAYLDGGYAAKETLQNGLGYWVKFAAEQYKSILGGAINADSVQVIKGWNLIGSISQPVSVASITSEPPGIVTSDFFSYSQSYQSADTIYPARGYWVKTGESGLLVLSSSPASGVPSKNRIRIVPTSELPPYPPSERAVREGLPEVYGLEEGYPNPFNPVTTIRYELPVDSKVSLKVYNILGQAVGVLADEVQNAGSKSLRWDAGSFSSGVYFYRLDASSTKDPARTFSKIRKVVLIR